MGTSAGRRHAETFAAPGGHVILSGASRGRVLLVAQFIICWLFKKKAPYLVIKKLFNGNLTKNTSTQQGNKKNEGVSSA